MKIVENTKVPTLLEFTLNEKKRFLAPLGMTAPRNEAKVKESLAMTEQDFLDKPHHLLFVSIRGTSPLEANSWLQYNLS